MFSSTPVPSPVKLGTISNRQQIASSTRLRLQLSSPIQLSFPPPKGVTCCICRDIVCHFALFPCGHPVCCYDAAQLLANAREFQLSDDLTTIDQFWTDVRCPMCRTAVQINDNNLPSASLCVPGGGVYEAVNPNCGPVSCQRCSMIFQTQREHVVHSIDSCPAIFSSCEHCGEAYGRDVVAHVSCCKKLPCNHTGDCTFTGTLQGIVAHRQIVAAVSAMYDHIETMDDDELGSLALSLQVFAENVVGVAGILRVAGVASGVGTTDVPGSPIAIDE